MAWEGATFPEQLMTHSKIWPSLGEHAELARCGTKRWHAGGRAYINNGLLGRAISSGSTYVRLGDNRPYVVGADRKARGGWVSGQSGSEFQREKFPSLP